MQPSHLLLATLGAYLTGSIPFGLLVARATGGPDPRAIGSGRLGGTNSLRALGRRRAVVVSTGDVLKGFLPIVAVRAVGGDDLLVSLAALCAVIGATRSVWVGFKGGRGIATGVGTALAIAPLAVAVAAPFFFLLIWRTRIVSIGSLAAALAFAPAALIARATSGASIDIEFAAYAIIGPALVWIAHADNIARLRNGSERRFDVEMLQRD
ncbi:MAG: glycerol-3-phosphate 1-O-acyltransferase PlsY [Candidatus Limnocylindrus sp.]